MKNIYNIHLIVSVVILTLTTEIALSQISKEMKNIKLIPEWEKPKGVALVYPEKLPENPEETIKKNDLLKFYDVFIQEIIDKADISEITVIHRRGLKEKINKFKSNRIEIKPFEIGYVQDIWIRDWAPIAQTTIKSVIKANYFPSYFASGDKWYAEQDHNSGIKLATEHLGMNVKNLLLAQEELVLDGGNFIHNGNGVGITTNRIITDNESYSIKEIRDVFKKQMGISKLIIVPVEPGDITGHIDGMIRFIDEKTVVVATYPDDYREGKDFLDNIAIELKQDFKVIRITNKTPKYQQSNDFPSAYGNYINYLRIGNQIFLPQYGIDTDKAARIEYEKYFVVIPVSVDINKLADLGGVLNCITWTYY